MNEQTFDYVKSWAERTREILANNLNSLQVIESGELKASLRVRTDVIGSNIRVRFSFLAQGKYADMGAGKGQKANTKKTLRKAKKWYSRAFFSRLGQLQMAVGRLQVEEITKKIRDELQ